MSCFRKEFVISKQGEGPFNKHSVAVIDSVVGICYGHETQLLIVSKSTVGFHEQLLISVMKVFLNSYSSDPIFFFKSFWDFASTLF